MKIIRKSILVNLVLAVICGTSMPWARPVKAEFAPLECVSGNCQIITQVQDTDLLKTFPASNTKVRLRLDTKNLVQANSTQETFSYRAYEINGSGQKEIISKTYVKFPTKAKNSKDYQVDLDIKPFIGTKKIYVEWFTSNDELALTNSFNVKATGSYANNQAESLNIGGSNVDKDAMIDFFVNNVKWTANTRGDAKAISVVPDQNTGTVEVNIPIIPSGSRVPLKRRQVSYNETGTGSGTGSGTGGSPVTPGGNSLIDADFPLVLENGNIMALTSSQDPTVPVLVITSHRRIGINQDAPVATLDIAKGNNAAALPIMKFEAGPLVAAPVNGSFEYDTAGDLYFTSHGVRKYFVLNSNSSSAVKKLESISNSGKSLTLSGLSDVALNATAAVSLNLPSANGTLARLEDLVSLPASSVNTSQIANASITNLKLAPDAVTTDKILDGTILGADIASNTIASGNILDGTISLSDLSTGVLNAFDNKKLASNNVGALSGQAITFDGLHNAVFQSNGANVNLLLPSGSGTLARLSDITAPGADSVTTAALANGSVTNVKLANDSVTSSKIVDGTIQAFDLAPEVITSSLILDGTIQAVDLMNGSVTNVKLANDSVTSSKIVDGTIQAFDLAPNIVTTSLILDGTIQAVDLMNGSVTNVKLDNDSVTSSKIVDGTIQAFDLAPSVLDNLETKKLLSNNPGAFSGQAITFNGLHNAVFQSNGASVNLLLPAGSGTLARLSDIGAPGAGSVTTAALADGSVTNIKLAADAVTSNKILDGTVALIDLAADSVNSSKIVNGSILPADLDPTVFSSFIAGAGSVTSTSILDGTIQTADLADGSVTNIKLAADAVTSNKILDGTVALIDLAADSVNSSKIVNGSILPADLDPTVFSSFIAGAGSVTSTSILDGTIQTADLADGSVTNIKLAADAVTSNKILDGTIIGADLANATITAAKIAGNTITGNNILDGSILPADLDPSVFSSLVSGPNTVNSLAIVDGTIQAIDLADGSVTNVKLAADAVTSNKILDGTITGADLADGTVALIDLAADSVNSSKIVNGSILPADLDPTVFSSFTPGAGSVTTTSILDGTILTADLADGSVTNAKLAADAVTSNKILDGTVTGADIADGTITGTDIGTNTITSTNILDGSITINDLNATVINSLTVADGSITNVKLATDAVTSNKILDGTITGADLADGTVALIDLAADSVNSSKIVNGSILPADLDPTVFSSFTAGTNTVTSNSIVDATIQAADLADGSVTNNKIVSVDASKITGSIPVSLNLAKGVLASSTLDFTPDHSFFTKAMTANTTFTAVNLKQGSRYVLKLSGSFIPTFPSFFVLNPERSYNPQLQNYFQFEVIDDSVGSPLVIVRLNQQPL